MIELVGVINHNWRERIKENEERKKEIKTDHLILL